MAIGSFLAAAAPALISAGGSLLAGKAANKGNKAAIQAQMDMYNQTRSDLMPFMSVGTSALGQLASLWGLGGTDGSAGTGVPNTGAMMSALQNFPGYQFGLSQGIRAYDNSGSARGMTLSGAQAQALNQFGQDYGISQAWTPYVSMLSGLASLGQNAAAQTGNAGTNAAAGASKFYAQNGANNASMWGNLAQTAGQSLPGILGAFGGGGGGSGSGVAVGGPQDILGGGTFELGGLFN